MNTENKIEQGLRGFHFKSVIDLAKLSMEERGFIQGKSLQLKLKKKAVLYWAHDKPKGVYFLKKGKIKIEQISYDGSVQVLFIYCAGEAFGFRPIIGQELQPVNAVALEDCELDFLPAVDFLALLKSSVKLSNLLLVGLSHEFTVLINRINLFAQRGIKERLAFALLVLNEKYKYSNSLVPEADIKINRTDLANYVGTSLETLVRTLKYFNERKLVRTKGKSIFIINFEALFILSGIQ